MKVGIIGLGLIGGSLGLALKRAYGSRAHIKGLSRSEGSVKKALEIGAIDEAVKGIGDMGDREVIIISTPILAMKDILKEMGEVLGGRIIITDTGSTKRKVMEWASSYLGGDLVFVGGHPMAGKEKWGVEEARADIFEGNAYCLVRGKGAGDDDVRLMEDVVRRIGAFPILMDAEEHDNLVGGISHLPLALSVALILTAMDERWEEMGKLASTGFKDMTRLASGNPEINRDIFLTNAENIKIWINKYIRRLEEIRDKIEKEEILGILRRGREERERWLHKRWRKDS